MPLTKQKTPYIAFLQGALLGVAVFLLLYGPSTLQVTYDSWIYRGYIEKDIIQSYAGWLYYRAAPWDWPITVAGNLSIPYGASIVFTDSIPLAALFFKMFSPLLPATFQYFGLWALCNFALQGGFSVLLLQRFGLGRVYSLLASLIFVCMPIFIEKNFRHGALASQWIILAALLLYFKARRDKRFPYFPFWLLASFVLTIHTYFLPMVYAILLAALLEYAAREKKVRAAAAFLFICFSSTLFTAYAFGLLTRGGGGAASGFGHYSMNLNALFNPSSFNSFSPDNRLVWSAILPTRLQQLQQYEGFNYLGAGILLALCGMLLYGFVRGSVALVKRNTTVFVKSMVFVREHLWLLFIMGVLALFSLSHVVTWDDRILFTVPISPFLFSLASIFRASGRLFWPVSYLLTLAPLVFYGRIFHKYWKFAAISILVGVQVLDLSGTLWEKHEYFTQGPLVQQDEFTSAGWIFLAQNYSEVICLGNLFDYELAAGIIRYNPFVQTNMISTNRGSFSIIERSYTPAIEMLVSGEPLKDGTLYLCSDINTFQYILNGLHPDARGYQTGHYFAFANPLPDCPLPEFFSGLAE